ncbi:MAG: hypothetical protein IKU05_07670 [Bacteroidales bacterium]|nr:hypothetical protein [Bacteroidales bacterium]
MRRLLLLLLTILIPFVCIAQNFKNNRKEAEKVKKAGTSFWAESNDCLDLDEAKTMAMQDLITNIYKNCDPMMAFFDDDDNHEGQSMKVFNTFKSSIMSASKELVLDNEDGVAKVFRYIKKDAFYDICDKREELINLYLTNGIKADNEEKENASIGDALRYYYWSLILCYSHPYGSNLTFEEPVNYDNVVIKDWVYERIDYLLKKIQFIPKPKPVFKSRDGVAYELMVTDGADLIPWLKFEYNDGTGDIESSVESGRASVELVDKDINEIEIRIYVENKMEAKARAKEVYTIMQILDQQIYFASAVKKVNVKKAKDKEIERQQAMLAQTEYHDSTIVAKIAETEKLIEENKPDDMAEFQKAMKIIEKAIRNNDILEASKYFTEDGLDMFINLLSNGRYYILGTPEYNFLEFKDQVICRSIPMQFNFKNNVGFIRNVVFRFDKKTCKVSSIAFRLTDIAEIDILGKDQWKSDSRMILINFLEDYQTAYALKRIDYLDKIFSDDALIIVGTVLKQKQKGDNMQLSSAARVRYDTLSKGRFIDNLRNVFVKNEFVNIRFLDTDFTQHQSGMELYGVQLKQEYLSSNYGDVGYLFLMVDLREELPVIHVRTWEPEKTENPIGFDDIEVKII